MDIKQLQANLAATVRGNDILKCEVQNALDALSYATPKLKYLELQVLKKDENINQLTNDLQECMKELGVVKAILPKVFQERDFMWDDVKSYSEMNMLLDYEINMLKRKEVALEGTSIQDIVHQNSTCGAAENVGTAAKPNGIMHEPVRADKTNAFSNNSSFVLSCIQTTVDIPSKTAGPSTFELQDHALVGPGREGGVRVGESPTLLGSELPKILSLHNQPSFLTLETDRAAVENVFNLKGIRHFGHCISYADVASVLLGAAVSRNLSVTDPLAARRDALQSTVIRLREGFRRKDQNSSASSSEGCGSSVKRSSSADAGHLGNTTVPCTGDGSTWNNIERFNSDKSIDNGRPSLAPRSSSCRSVVQEPEVGSSYVDRNLEHNSSLVVCSSSGLESQEKLSDPRITSMLKRKGRHTDRELANLLQDKGLDPNFAVVLKENGLDPMILALLQRSSLDADREHRDSNPPVTDSNDVEDMLPNHISFSEELRLPRIRKVASTL
ncbi:Calpain-type cysteine protease DEK1 [Capsicum chinense]|nr:Calpain-type cysteine protease DEK1 [Capsicum chinense]